ncbi:MAG: cold shock domain-containing protein [Gammaproteobacteria bacterium]|nr:cold shock domain-containing protein [Gammaproteobacteria bacterium]
MDTGKIKMYNAQKGFGFIKPDNGDADVFLHVTAAKEQGAQFCEGQVVRYRIAEGRDGRKAAVAVEIVTPVDA